MGFYDEIPLFLDTNLGTHFMLSVSHDITAGELKGKLGMEHFSCFPNLGKIKVHGLMVKKKSFLYHLSDSMAIKHIFERASETWILHLDANLDIEDRQRPSPIIEEQAEMRFPNSSCKKNGKKMNIFEHHDPVEANRCAKNREEKSTFGLRFNVEENMDENCKSSQSIMEDSIKNIEAISVTGIISRFFMDFDEVDSCFRRPKHSHAVKLKNEHNLIHSMTRAIVSRPNHGNHGEAVESDADTQCSSAKQKDENMARTTITKAKKLRARSRKVGSKQSSLSYIETSNNKSRKHRVGNRLVQAANSMSRRPRTIFLSMCGHRISPNSSLLVRRIAFDADDFVD